MGVPRALQCKLSRINSRWRKEEGSSRVRTFGGVKFPVIDVEVEEVLANNSLGEGAVGVKKRVCVDAVAENTFERV